MFAYHFPDPSDPASLSTSPIWMFGTCYKGFRNIEDARIHLLWNRHDALLQFLDVGKPLPFQGEIVENRDLTRASIKHLSQFLPDFTNLIWFTYRKDFPTIEPSHFTCDMGEFWR